jgi:hypothetical protein
MNARVSVRVTTGTESKGMEVPFVMKPFSAQIIQDKLSLLGTVLSAR